jgi:hypothetical protein
MTASLPKNSGSWITDRLKKWTTPDDDITEEPQALSADKGVAALVERIADESLEELPLPQWLKEDQEEGDNR